MVRRREAVAGTGVVVAVVLLILVKTRWGPLRRLDLDVAGDLNAWTSRHDTIRTTLEWVSTIGQPATWQGLAIVTALVLWRRDRLRAGLFAVVTVVGASLLSNIVKLLVDRSRPVVDIPLIHPAGSSFPSGHAMASFAAGGVAVVLITTHRAVVTVVAALAVAAVGFSRVALGAHYVSDVLGAWAIATAWICVTAAVFLTDRLLTDRLRNPAHRAGWRPRAGTRRPSG